MPKTIVHVNQHKIKANAKNGTSDPVLTVKTYKSNTYGHEVIMPEGCKVVYSPDKPLSCGARVWIETQWGGYSPMILETLGEALLLLLVSLALL